MLALMQVQAWDVEYFKSSDNQNKTKDKKTTSLYAAYIFSTSELIVMDMDLSHALNITLLAATSEMVFVSPVMEVNGKSTFQRPPHNYSFPQYPLTHLLNRPMERYLLPSGFLRCTMEVLQCSLAI
jgi:hypothetical protein